MHNKHRQLFIIQSNITSYTSLQMFRCEITGDGLCTGRPMAPRKMTYLSS